MADKKDKTGGVMSDMDSIDTLSLSMIPLTSTTLKNARLIKNMRMETAVELYNDPIAGSLQIYPAEVADQIAASPRDQEIISQLASLHSYDVYSLRSSLKKLGIETPEIEALDLSDGMKESLGDISVQFTRPLIEKIFGTGKIDANDAKALQKMFRDPDVNRVRENLKTMTQSTGIPLNEIPKFLEEYSDVFLSVAYYKFTFENISPETERFFAWIRELRSHRDVTSSPKTASSCKNVDESMRFLIYSIRERLTRFQTNFEMFWSGISRESFTRLRQVIEENHSSMGPVLCGVSVKMRGWSKGFADSAFGGPSTRAKYVMTEMEPGIERLKTIESEARKKLGMAALKV